MTSYQSRVYLVSDIYQEKIEPEVGVEIYQTTVDSIGIDSIRALIEEAHRRPREGFSKKLIVLAGAKITVEAQQSALKILEEPPSDTEIILILPDGTRLLDTVLSRVQVERKTASVVSQVFHEWLQLSYADRIKEIETRTKAKDMVWMQSFKQELQKYAEKNNHTSLADLQLVLANFLTRGASNKMLLEHLALSLPLTR